eukprot:CAMPEP_0197238710 /NCGR_PEP_ID=MMETSP1429-20130617/5238_1 /TAXON_ID=49237 /ORGANISM="Chaetoceros  sp., Strain UNC1202" /LENGTH=52 /DNA_ID=CAMNT_0042697949 /DNA_START=161 /DNA_END=316 /DNA_ORIENTATION=+
MVGPGLFFCIVSGPGAILTDDIGRYDHCKCKCIVRPNLRSYWCPYASIRLQQ